MAEEGDEGHARDGWRKEERSNEPLLVHVRGPTLIGLFSYVLVASVVFGRESKGI